MAQTVFITGTSSGIGKATALYFAEQGWMEQHLNLTQQKNVRKLWISTRRLNKRSTGTLLIQAAGHYQRMSPGWLAQILNVCLTHIQGCEHREYSRSRRTGCQSAWRPRSQASRRSIS